MPQYKLLKDAIDPAGTIWSQNPDMTFGPYNIPRGKLDGNPQVFQPYNPSGQWNPVQGAVVWSIRFASGDAAVLTSYQLQFDGSNALIASLLANNLLFPGKTTADQAAAQIVQSLANYQKTLTESVAAAGSFSNFLSQISGKTTTVTF